MTEREAQEVVEEPHLLFFEEVFRDLARQHRPKMIIAGGSAFPRAIDFAPLGEIAREVGAVLMADIAHPAGLVAAGLHPTPIGHAHYVTTTTHKTLRGPRGGMIMCRAQDAATLDRRQVELSGDRQHRIADLLRLDAPRTHSPEKRVVRVGLVVLHVVGRGKLVRMAGHEMSDQLFRAPAVVHEPDGQMIEQGGVARTLTGAAEVVRCGHESAAEQVMPETVDHDARQERIDGRVGHLLCQLEPAKPTLLAMIIWSASVGKSRAIVTSRLVV